jgi:hypothetical protein
MDESNRDLPDVIAINQTAHTAARAIASRIAGKTTGEWDRLARKFEE